MRVGSRTLACVLVLGLSTPLPAQAEDGGVPSDAPVATRLPNGSLLINPSAEKRLDVEMQRLQGVERTHKAESWMTVVLISVGIGLVAGAAAGAAVTLAVKSAPAATPPSP